MTPDQIREAACVAFDAVKDAMMIRTAVLTLPMLQRLDAVFRAGMEAGREEAQKEAANADAKAREKNATGRPMKLGISQTQTRRIR